MADQILRVCPNCEGTDRYKDGKCKACVRLRVKAYNAKTVTPNWNTAVNGVRRISKKCGRQIGSGP